MNFSECAVLRLCEGFTRVGLHGSMEECLIELSELTARVLNAKGCTILLLNEEDVAQASLRGGAEFGSLPVPLGRSDKASASKDIPAINILRGGHGDMESMVSTIVLHGKIIGVIHACRPLQPGGFSNDDLALFNIMTPLITKSIQVIQLQYILNSRFTQIALSRSTESAMGDLISGVMQNPNQIARLLARSFYREMLSAGLNASQIIFAATEVLSELSASLRKHSASHRRRGGHVRDALEVVFKSPADEKVTSPPQSAGGERSTLLA